jgi:hypothetical protein
MCLDYFVLHFIIVLFIVLGLSHFIIVLDCCVLKNTCIQGISLYAGDIDYLYLSLIIKHLYFVMFFIAYEVIVGVGL